MFGQVTNDEMQLNHFGCIARQQWDWLVEQYPYVVSHGFVVMPNHIHGIIEIDREHFVGTGRDLSAQQLAHETTTIDTTTQKIKSISELMGVYKTTTSKLIRTAGLTDFTWQRSFHDHIIRYDNAYNHIKNYILANPERWKDDKFYQSVS